MPTAKKAGTLGEPPVVGKAGMGSAPATLLTVVQAGVIIDLMNRRPDHMRDWHARSGARSVPLPPRRAAGGRREMAGTHRQNRPNTLTHCFIKLFLNACRQHDKRIATLLPGCEQVHFCKRTTTASLVPVGTRRIGARASLIRGTPQAPPAMDQPKRLWRLIPALAVFALAACGPPDEPRQEARTGALGYAIAEAQRQQSVATPAGLTGAAPAVDEREASRDQPIPYVVIRFDRPKITYEDALYSALSRALDRYPAAAFDVVLAMPPLVAGANAEEATARGERRMEDIVLLMTDIGLPSERVRIAATTDAAADVDEIRIYVR